MRGTVVGSDCATSARKLGVMKLPEAVVLKSSTTFLTL